MIVKLNVLHFDSPMHLHQFNPLYQTLGESSNFRFSSFGSLYIRPIIVLGKTGYGKSSLLNTLIGMDVFPTDPVRSCTTKIDTALFALSQSHYLHPNYLAFCDLPGIGENPSNDSQYLDWYRAMSKSASCIIYVLRADERHYSKDLEAFDQLFSTPSIKGKVVIALNCADKIEPINRNNNLSPEQLIALTKKVDRVAKQFPISTDRIIPCSASTKYGIDNLLKQVLAIYQDHPRSIRVREASNQILHLNSEFLDSLLTDFLFSK